MANNIEWGHANYGGALLTPADVEDLTQDEDETAGDWALEIGSDGAMLLYGKLEEIQAWLQRAQDSVAEPLRKEQNKAIKAWRKEAGLPKCEHDWVLTEEGYARTWVTTIREDGAIDAHFTGTEDWSDDGDGRYWLHCRQCEAVKPVGDTPILWEGVE